MDEHNGESAASILIVDDDPSAIQVLHGALSEYSHIRFATSGSEGLRLAGEHPPDLILLDLNMPGITGFQVCAELKRHETLRDTPVIVVTANSDLQFEMRAIEAGAADFLVKPLSPIRVRLRVKLHLQLKTQLDALRKLSSTDPLTGVANRRTFDQRIESEWRRALRSGQPLALAAVDVDFFKTYNDTYGHPRGDECLRQVAEHLSRHARRAGDLVARVGGEEFALLLPETSEAGALHVAKAVRSAVSEARIAHSASTVAPHVTVSIGVGTFVRGADLASWHAWSRRANDMSLVEVADRALYLAKRGGRNRVEHLRVNDEASSEKKG